jgi:hypothetical protein
MTASKRFGFGPAPTMAGKVADGAMRTEQGKPVLIRTMLYFRLIIG